MATVALLCAIVVASYFFLFFDTPYLTYKNLPFPTLMKSVSPGGVIPVSVHRCNSEDTTKVYTTTHTLQNTRTMVSWILPDARVAIDPGCIVSVSMVNAIPREVPPGTYRLFGTAMVEGAFRTHHVDWYTEPFIVTAAKEKP